MQIRYTTAPVEYDGFGTINYSTVALDHNKPVRKVIIQDEHFYWQEGRYGSGGYSCWDGIQYNTLLRNNIISPIPKTEADKRIEWVKSWLRDTPQQFLLGMGIGPSLFPSSVAWDTIEGVQLTIERSEETTVWVRYMETDEFYRDRKFYLAPEGWKLS